MTHQDDDLCTRLRALERRIIDRRPLTGFDTEALPQAANEIEQLRKERDAFQRGVIDAVAENERLCRELSYRVHTDEDIKVQNTEIERLRNIALDALPYLQQCAASMGSSSNRAKLRSVIAQIIQFVPDDAEQRPVKGAGDDDIR